MERLQKVMARAGIGSRRACEELIRAKRVEVNGSLAVLGQKVDPQKDKIKVDGKSLLAEEAKRYLILNKPLGFITTSKDQFSRKGVLDLLTNVKERVYPVGRLDYDSQGLVFLTNDGDLAYRVMHPKFELPKTYLLHLDSQITMDAVYRLRTGVNLEDGRTLPAQVVVLKSKGASSVLRITISEGRNRQLRRMCKHVGYEVLQLTRVGIGPLSIAGLSTGKYRDLQPQERQQLFESVGLAYE